jgi:hypothetical protein
VCRQCPLNEVEGALKKEEGVNDLDSFEEWGDSRVEAESFDDKFNRGEDPGMLKLESINVHNNNQTFLLDLWRKFGYS